MRIAYLINQFLKLATVFIRREIRPWSGTGFQVVRIAHRGVPGENGRR